MNFPTVVGISAGVMTSISMLPQLIKTFKEKECGDISVWMLLLLIAGIIVWIYYGVLKQDLPIIITNSFSASVNFILLILYCKYKKQESD